MAYVIRYMIARAQAGDALGNLREAVKTTAWDSTSNTELIAAATEQLMVEYKDLQWPTYSRTQGASIFTHLSVIITQLQHLHALLDFFCH